MIYFISYDIANPKRLCKVAKTLENYGLRVQYSFFECEMNQKIMENLKPENHLVKAILITLFCCLPFGIVSIVNSSKVDSAFNTGNYDEAERLSKEANKWANYGLWIGIAVYVIYIVFMIATGVLAALV